MPLDLGVFKEPVIIGKPRAEGRFVLWPHERASRKLHAMNGKWPALDEPVFKGRVVAQPVAGFHQRGGAGIAIEEAFGVIAILQIDAAGSLSVWFGKADCIFLRCRHPDAFGFGIVRAFAPVAQHRCFTAVGEA